MSDDAISRQAAIEHFERTIDASDRHSKYNEGFIDGLEFCVNHLSTLPSVTPIPCKDAISRDAVLDACSQSINILDAMSRIEDLPSVTPKQRTGHWDDLTGLFFCSECDGGFAKPWRYCPECGAKMVEPQESEEQA